MPVQVVLLQWQFDDTILPARSASDPCNACIMPQGLSVVCHMLSITIISMGQGLALPECRHADIVCCTLSCKLGDGALLTLCLLVRVGDPSHELMYNLPA